MTFIHKLLTQTLGHLQNYAGFKVWKRETGFEKNSEKKKKPNQNKTKQQNKTDLSAWFPTFENLVT